MKVSIPRKPLASALRSVALPTKGVASATPILRGVRIDASDDGTVSFTCTNLDLTVTVDVEADKVFTPGSAVAPVALLSRLVDTFSGDAVEFTVDGDVLGAASGTTVADLRCLNLDEWPHVDHASGDALDVAPQQVELLRRIVGFASTDGTHGPLPGVHFVDGEAQVTDSYRLGIATLGSTGPTALIPATAVAAALKMTDGGLTVAIDGQTATIRGKGFAVTTRLIDGNYPPVHSLLRERSPQALTCASAPLLDALKRMTVLGSDTRRCDVTWADGIMRLTSTEADVGTVTDEIPARHEGDFAGPVRFNVAFLTEMVEAAAVDEITFGFDGAMKPVMVETDRLRQLVMPVRVTS